MTERQHPGPPPPLSGPVALVAATLLAWEVALSRVLAVRQWSHFAYLVITVALLGFGAAGTALSLGGRWAGARRARLHRLALVLFAPAVPLSHWLASRIPFEMHHLLMQQPARPWALLLLPFRSGSVLALELVLAVPFFLGACVILLGIQTAGERVGRLYGANMLGSGAGAAAVVGLLYLVRPGYLAAVLAVGAASAAWWAVRGGGRRWRRAGLGAVLAAAAAAWLSAEPVRPSQYKPLSTTLLAPDTRVEAERWSPLALLTLVSGSSLHLIDTLSLTYSSAAEGPLPPQMALFFDGDSPSPVVGRPAPGQTLAYLDYLPAAVPYHLLERPSVLLVGLGGGSRVLAALRLGARSVTAVEMDPLVVDLLRSECEEFTGGLLRRPGVRVVTAEARSYLESTGERFDLIEVPPLGSFESSAAGMFALSASYLFTVEGLSRAIDRLTPRGILALTRWDHYPERDGRRALATVVEAAERLGLEPRSRLALYRGYSTVTILFSRRPWTDDQLDTLRRICRLRGYDLCYYPGIHPEETNRYNQLPEPVYYLAARALLEGDREKFYRRAPFQVRPAADERPYFFYTFRWRSLPRLLRTLGTRWLGFVARGYVFLVLAFVQSTLLAAGLILGPLLLLGRLRRAPGKAAAGVYFASVGLGYMLLEIAFIQRFLLVVPSPVWSLAVVLATFLVGSGLGSLAADRFPGGPRRAVPAAVVGIAAVVGLYAAVLPGVLSRMLGWPVVARAGVSAALLAPLTVLMGLPFPSGFRLVRRRAEALTSWAWAVNGCASVAGASLATLVALEWGLRATLLVAVGCYLVALAVVGRLSLPHP